MPAYDPNNIFAKILRGELPCHKVYEDERAFAFLDIMPRAPGHTLVIPKSAARNMLDALSRRPCPHHRRGAARRQGGDDGFRGRWRHATAIQRKGRRTGRVHLHFHVIPRKDGVPMKPPASEKEKPEVLAENAKKLAAAITAG